MDFIKLVTSGAEIILEDDRLEPAVCGRCITGNGIGDSPHGRWGSGSGSHVGGGVGRGYGRGYGAAGGEGDGDGDGDGYGDGAGRSSGDEGDGEGASAGPIFGAIKRKTVRYASPRGWQKGSS